MQILILITGKLILIECPINWLTVKVTDFSINFRRSLCTIVRSADCGQIKLGPFLI